MTAVPDTEPELPNIQLPNIELPNTEVTVCAKGRERSSRSKPSEDVTFEGPGISLVSRKTGGRGWRREKRRTFQLKNGN